MKLTHNDARNRLAAHDHGVLCTVHSERGVDAVPVVYVLDEDGYIGVPIDTVKPKASSRLQREANLLADPRASLLVEHWDRHDWSKLWWVRAELRMSSGDQVREDSLAEALAQRFLQYRSKPFASVLVLRVVSLTGWSGAS